MGRMGQIGGKCNPATRKMAGAERRHGDILMDGAARYLNDRHGALQFGGEPRLATAATRGGTGLSQRRFAR
jgi:hypothetical protein